MLTVTLALWQNIWISEALHGCQKHGPCTEAESAGEVLECPCHKTSFSTTKGLLCLWRGPLEMNRRFYNDDLNLFLSVWLNDSGTWEFVAFNFFKPFFNKNVMTKNEELCGIMDAGKTKGSWFHFIENHRSL